MTGGIPGPRPTDAILGNLRDARAKGSVPEYLSWLHTTYGPVAGFWWNDEFHVSVGDPAMGSSVRQLLAWPLQLHTHMAPLMHCTARPFAELNDDEGWCP